MEKTSRRMDGDNREIRKYADPSSTLLQKIIGIPLVTFRTWPRFRAQHSLRSATAAGTLSLIVALGACSSTVETSPDSTPENEKSDTGTLFAPYLYLDSAQRPTLPEVADETGQTSFVLAFLLAGPQRCTPSWNSILPVDDDRLVAEVAQLGERGGDVVVATGGASGSYLENTCDSADDLAGAYAQALDAVGGNHLDVGNRHTGPDRPVIPQAHFSCREGVANTASRPMVAVCVPETTDCVVSGTQNVINSPGVEPDNASSPGGRAAAAIPTGNAICRRGDAAEFARSLDVGWCAATAPRPHPRPAHRRPVHGIAHQRPHR